MYIQLLKQNNSPLIVFSSISHCFFSQLNRKQSEREKRKENQPFYVQT